MISIFDYADAKPATYRNLRRDTCGDFTPSRRRPSAQRIAGSLRQPLITLAVSTSVTRGIVIEEKQRFRALNDQIVYASPPDQYR